MIDNDTKDFLGTLEGWAVDADLGRSLLGAGPDIREAKRRIETQAAEIERAMDYWYRQGKDDQHQVDAERIETLEAEIARLQKLVDTAGIIFSHNLAPDKGFHYFICGEGGTKDTNNLPEKLFVCPAYGCDWFQIYERTDNTAGTEW